MPRNVSGIYFIPPGTEGFPDTTIESEKYNNYIHDVETDLNTPRPVIAGGTGGTSLEEALAALSAEKAAYKVDNYDTQVWVPGSFYSAPSATGSPITGHAFSGWVTSSDAFPVPPDFTHDNLNLIVYARDTTDTTIPTRLYIKEKRAGVWTASTWWSDGVYVATSPPSNPTRNSLWWDNETGLLYVFYIDQDNTAQWVIACPMPNTDKFLAESPIDGKAYGRKDSAWSRVVSIAGDTMTGGLDVGGNLNATGNLTATGTVNAGGNVTISKNTPALVLNKLATAQDNLIVGNNNGIARWAVSFGNAVTETAGNVGSDFAIGNYTDAGVLVGEVLNFNRATGLGTVKADPQVPLGIATKAYVDRETANFYSLAGVKSFDVQVPAGKTTAIMNSVIVPTTAADMRLIVQLSLTAGVFETDVGDYAREGFFHSTTTDPTGVGAVVGDASVAGMQVHTFSNNINYPTIWDGTLFLKRLNAVNGRFIGDFRGRSYASSYGWTHSFFYNHMTPAASGVSLSVVAFRITSDLASDNWGDGSYLSIIWK